MFESGGRQSILEYPSISICDTFPTIEIIDDKKTTVTTTQVPLSMVKRNLESGHLVNRNGSLKLDLRSKQPLARSFFEESRTYPVQNEFKLYSSENIVCKIMMRNDGSMNNDGNIKSPNLESFSRPSHCWTFFSQIDSGSIVVPKVSFGIRSDLIRINEEMAYFAINFSYMTKGKEAELPETKKFILAHRSKAYPSKQSLIFSSRQFIIKPNKTYDLTFSKKTVVKLPKPYKTDCDYYRSEINSTDIYSLSRDLCINSCRNERVYNQIKCLTLESAVINGQKYSEYGFCPNKDHLDGGDEPYIYAIEGKANDYCLSKCKVDCNEEVYETDLRESEDSYLPEVFGRVNTDSNMSYVAVMAKHFADTNYYHLPKMKLTDFLCNIGGLFSLYLGLSVLSVYDFFAIICMTFKNRV